MHTLPALFTVESQQTGTTTTVTVTGEIDLATVGQVASCIAAALNDPPETLVVDLQGSEFIETAGARMLVQTEQRALAANVRFIVVSGETVPRVLELSGVGQHLRTPIRAVLRATG